MSVRTSEAAARTERSGAGVVERCVPAAFRRVKWVGYDSYT
jgi:hypothetical protein